MKENTTPHPRLGLSRALLTYLTLFLLAGFGSAALAAPPVHHDYPWIADFQLPVEQSALGHDPDGGGISNLLEYAFGRYPAEADDTLLPAVQTVEVEREIYLMLEIEMNEAAPEVEPVVESSPDLVSWSSGAGHPVVLEEPPPLLRVRDAIPMDAASRCFLRVLASQL